MKLTALLCVLLSINVVSMENCSYQDLLNYLQLTKNKDLFTLARPVKNHTQPTEVQLDVLLYAVLDVREIDQTFISYVWTIMYWKNDFIQWDKDDFCGIEEVAVPIETLWKPDITIEEMTERDKSSQSPYLVVYYNGTVGYKNDQVVISTCQMHVYKFPFDTQSCTLSFRSVLLSDENIRLQSIGNSTEATEWSLEVMRTQYEWVFLGITVTNKTVNPFDYPQDMLSYTISLKRRSMLYIVNFILPVLLFLTLDLASFLMSDTGGEKLGFKITVLLAVTVMQLLLNEILPASSKRIPLIAVFCIGIFFLMLLSLLESIVVLYLINKDHKPDQDQSDLCSRLKDVFSRCDSVFLSEYSAEKAQLHDKVVVTLLTELLQSQKEEVKPGYWTTVTKTINRVFFICYFTATVGFLAVMVFLWADPSLNEI